MLKTNHYKSKLSKDKSYDIDEIDSVDTYNNSIPMDRDKSNTRTYETHSKSPIFNRSVSSNNFQRYDHHDKKCSSEHDRQELDRKGAALESLKSMSWTQSSSHHSNEYSFEHIGNRRKLPNFSDNSFIRWPSESESNSSCDEDESIPLSKIPRTKRSVSDKRCIVGKLNPTKNPCKEGNKRKKINGLDLNIPNIGERSELTGRNKSKSKLNPSKISKTKIVDLANNANFTFADKMNGQKVSRRCASDISDITKQTKFTTPEKDSYASLKKWVPFTPDLFDSSSSPSGLTLTTPETPFDSRKWDNSYSGFSKIQTTSPDSPDLVFLGASGPKFPTTSPSSRRKRVGASDIKQHRKKQKINVTQPEDDILQLVEQLNKDEDYAKKLQEEMDKEFAFSLAQSETVHQFPAPPLPLPALPPFNNGHNYPFHHQHGWQTPTSLHGHQRLPNRGGAPSEIDIENHLLALLEETPPRRRGRRGRGGGRRPPRSRYGFMIQSPVGDGNDYDALLQLAEQMGDVQNKGINNNQINRLPIKKFKKYDKNNSADEECSICMCEYEDNDSMRMLPCFHCFHSGCVDKWLTNNASCPVCRVDVKLD